MTHWIVGAVLLLVVSLILDLALLAYAMYTLLAVLLLSRYLTRVWANNLQATRACNRLTADVGDTVAVNIDIENRGSLPVLWCLIEDLLPRKALIHSPPNLAVQGRRTKLLMVRSGGKSSLRYQVRCNRRGYYQLGPLVLETGDLFGLHRRYRVATQPHFLLVYPRVVPVVGYEISSRRPIGEVKMTYRLFEDPTRISGVRRYESGDPLNRVHWRATARTGELHSKLYEPSTVAGTTILLEHHQTSHDHQNEPHRSELAVTAAASLANAVYEMGQQVGLITNGRDAADRIRLQGWDYDMRTRDAAREAAAMLPDSDRLQPLLVETRRGADQLIRILETLARVELTDGLTLPQLIAEAGNRMPRDAAVVVMLPGVTEEFAIALGNLRRQGYAVTAILNLWDEYDFAQAAGPLLAAGIEAHHLKDEAGIETMCRRVVHRV
jgi:uncharacterized protein (DUF58 family)